eukprot:g4362.t1
MNGRLSRKLPEPPTHDELRHQMRKMMHAERKAKHERKHTLKHKLARLRRWREAVQAPTWLPDAEASAVLAGKPNASSGGAALPETSVASQISRRFSPEEIEQTRSFILQHIAEEEERLLAAIKPTPQEVYQRQLDESHDRARAKAENRRARSTRAVQRYTRKRASEFRPRARHDASWKMKTNAGTLIQTPFAGTGPSPESDMPKLKEGADLWPVLPERTGAGRLPGRAPWYRTTNGRDFGDQVLEQFPEHYREQVLRNKRVAKRNAEIRRQRDEREAAIELVRELGRKPKPAWKPGEQGKIFSVMSTIRPPTEGERKKANAQPSRAFAGHRLEGMPVWKCK